MPLFRTSVLLPSVFPEITYQSQLLALGSCFAETMGKQLVNRKFNASINPSGIIYNPHSIAQLIQRLLSGEAYTQDDLFEHNGLWHSYEHHSRFSSTTKAETLDMINRCFMAVAEKMEHYTHVVITLGTASVYKLKGFDKIVANCHKVPAAHFVKERLAIPQITLPLGKAIREWRQINKELKVILTLSPVRHLKDGIQENNLSKASLLLAVDQLCQQLQNVHYFPSYEIQMDELRDYRFYASDMAHPSEVAVDYIWEQFSKVCFTDATRQIMKRVEKVVRATRHKPFHPQSEAHQQFVRKQLEVITALKKEVNGLEGEEQCFLEQLID